MKVISLEEYKQQKALERQIQALDQIGVSQYHLMSPIEQKGYRNFMRLLRALDEKHKDKEK